MSFGSNLSEFARVAFSFTPKTCEPYCHNSAFPHGGSEGSRLPLESLAGAFKIKIPRMLGNAEKIYWCVEEYKYKASKWAHSAPDPLEDIEEPLLPLWLHITLVVILLFWSGLFSGLTLGLLSLDQTELKVIESCGTQSERQYARMILPLRARGNYLLCSLVLGNVLVNSTFTILLEELTSGLMAVVLATIGIVILGEIVPQSICSRYGLAIGAKTIWITKLFMFLTFPMSMPISKILDSVLGEEIGSVFDREKLMEYLRITKDYAKIENEELNMIFGALELSKKTAADVMTKLEDVYMIPYTAVLDFETVTDIVKRGYTRIPVYEGDPQHIVALLNAKDLAFVDPDDEIPLKTLCRFYNHPLNFVFEDETLDCLLREFKKGHSHMAFARRVIENEDKDPLYEITGLVTLEDVIEEIIQSEIIDETDVLTDNRKKMRRKDAQVLQDFSDFVGIGGGQQEKNVVSAQLAFAAFQFLSTAVRPFTSEFISSVVLRRLLTQNIFFTAKPNHPGPQNIYEAGKASDYFVLVLEGRVQVTVGHEKLVFETGPFSYFGLPAVTVQKNENGTVTSQTVTFVPDYSVTPLTPTVYMKITHGVYLAALQATRMDQIEHFIAQGSVVYPQLSKSSSTGDLPSLSCLTSNGDVSAFNDGRFYLRTDSILRESVSVNNLSSLALEASTSVLSPSPPPEASKIPTITTTSTLILKDEKEITITSQLT